jgi:hypothetical protein
MNRILPCLLLATLAVLAGSPPDSLRADQITYVGEYSGELGAAGRDYQYKIFNKGAVTDPAPDIGDWFAAGYDRSDWNTGDSPFGNDFPGNAGLQDHRTEWGPHSFLYVYKEFTLDEPIDMTAYYAVDNGIDVYVNGQLVRSVNEEGYTHYWEYQDELPASLFSAGVNSLAFFVEDHGNYTFFDFALRGEAGQQGGGGSNESPEPSTLVLLGLGGLGVAGYRVRRRKS